MEALLATTRTRTHTRRAQECTDGKGPFPIGDVNGNCVADTQDAYLIKQYRLIVPGGSSAIIQFFEEMWSTSPEKTIRNPANATAMDVTFNNQVQVVDAAHLVYVRYNMRRYVLNVKTCVNPESGVETVTVDVERAKALDYPSDPSFASHTTVHFVITGALAGNNSGDVDKFKSQFGASWFEDSTGRFIAILQASPATHTSLGFFFAELKPHGFKGYGVSVFTSVVGKWEDAYFSTGDPLNGDLKLENADENFELCMEVKGDPSKLCQNFTHMFVPFAIPTPCEWNATSGPSVAPTPSPTTPPSFSPSGPSTIFPSVSPSTSPTISPSKSPSTSPTTSPTLSPTTPPSVSPTMSPTISPSSTSPSVSPSSSPSVSPTKSPSASPSQSPTTAPTAGPSISPTVSPTLSPSHSPSESPTTTTTSPTTSPTVSPSTIAPTVSPTQSPTTSSPTTSPTRSPTTTSPSTSPSIAPTSTAPSKSPSVSPTTAPSSSPPTSTPTNHPSVVPTTSPSTSPSMSPTHSPSVHPTNTPTTSPSAAPTITSPTVSPTAAPTTASPTTSPTLSPSSSTPTVSPTKGPVTTHPTVSPSTSPTTKPTTSTPTITPSSSTPSRSPTTSPTHSPTTNPTTSNPTTSPSMSPTVVPSQPPTSHSPTMSPSHSPTTNPTTSNPTTSPSMSPTVVPSQYPTSHSPTTSPSLSPTATPTTSNPTASPSMSPTLAPSISPTAAPSGSPTASPTDSPSTSPTHSPTSSSPTLLPTVSTPTKGPLEGGRTHSPSLGPTPDRCYEFECSYDCVRNSTFTPVMKQGDSDGSGSRSDGSGFESEPPAELAIQCGWDSTANRCRKGQVTTEEERVSFLESSAGACSHYTTSPSVSPSTSHPSNVPTVSPTTTPTTTTPTVTPTYLPSPGSPSVLPTSRTSIAPSMSPTTAPTAEVMPWWFLPPRDFTGVNFVAPTVTISFGLFCCFPICCVFLVWRRKRRQPKKPDESNKPSWVQDETEYIPEVVPRAGSIRDDASLNNPGLSNAYSDTGNKNDDANTAPRGKPPAYGSDELKPSEQNQTRFPNTVQKFEFTIHHVGSEDAANQTQANSNLVNDVTNDGLFDTLASEVARRKAWESNGDNPVDPSSEQAILVQIVLPPTQLNTTWDSPPIDINTQTAEELIYSPDTACTEWPTIINAFMHDNEPDKEEDENRTASKVTGSQLVEPHDDNAMPVSRLGPQVDDKEVAKKENSDDDDNINQVATSVSEPQMDDQTPTFPVYESNDDNDDDDNNVMSVSDMAQRLELQVDDTLPVPVGVHFAVAPSVSNSPDPRFAHLSFHNIAPAISIAPDPTQNPYYPWPVYKHVALDDAEDLYGTLDFDDTLDAHDGNATVDVRKGNALAASQDNMPVYRDVVAQPTSDNDGDDSNNVTGGMSFEEEEAVIKQLGMQLQAHMKAIIRHMRPMGQLTILHNDQEMRKTQASVQQKALDTCQSSLDMFNEFRSEFTET